jgi:hypothetical protein
LKLARFLRAARLAIVLDTLSSAKFPTLLAGAAHCHQRGGFGFCFFSACQRKQGGQPAKRKLDDDDAAVNPVAPHEPVGADVRRLKLCSPEI